MPDQLLSALLPHPKLDHNTPELPQGTGDETGIDKVLSVLYGALGLPGTPDNTWNRGGALLTAGAPFLPGFGKLRGAAAIDTGLDVLNASKAKKPSILDEVFAANPNAKPAYEKAMATQLPEAMEAKRTADAARYSRGAETHDALLDLMVGRPRPIPTETGFATAIPKEGLTNPIAQAPTATPSLSGKTWNSGTTVVGKPTVVNPDLVRQMRQHTSLDDLIKAYPDINPSTLRAVLSRDSWGWVK